MGPRSKCHSYIYISAFLVLGFYVVSRWESTESLTQRLRSQGQAHFENIVTYFGGPPSSRNATPRSKVNNTIVIPKNLTVSYFMKGSPTMQQNASQSLAPSINGYPHRICQCAERFQPMATERNFTGITSTCSNEATEYGIGQKVRSYALFIHENEDLPRYVRPIESNMEAHSELFPDWVTRIYSNISMTNPFVCALVCKYDTLFWCDIYNIPEMGDLSKMHGRTWRFLPLGDPTVDVFVSRDMDNTVFARERAAVAEWEASTLPFHAMRDNPGMSVPMLAGLWGAKNYLLGRVFSVFLQQTLIQAAMSHQLQEIWDETILQKYIHEPYHKLLLLVHDSYYCKKFDDFKTLPFPTQRIEDQTVGEHYIKGVTKYTYSVPPCPLECRPSYGKHWVYC